MKLYTEFGSMRATETTMVKRESDLRDWLAANLELIEEDLTLIGVEEAIHIPGTSRGSIDILARDRYGLFVVIELKKSNSTARDAVHELTKYTNLLRQRDGLGAEDVRCVLAATDWSELDTVMADFSATANYSIHCYKISFPNDGEIAAITPYTPPAGQKRLMYFTHHMFMLTLTEERRENLLKRVLKRFDEIGINSAVALSANYNGSNTDVYIRYGLYLVFADISDALKQMVIKTIRDDIQSTTEIAEVTYQNYLFAEFNEPLGDLIDEINITTAERLRTVCIDWHIEKVIRTGRLAKSVNIADDSDVIDDITNRRGEVRDLLRVFTSPKLKSAWQDAKRKLLVCVNGATEWRFALTLLLQEIEINYPEADVKIKAYVPNDIIMTIFKLVAKDDTRFVPELSIAYKTKDDRRMLVGAIAWDGKTRPQNLESVIPAPPGECLLAYIISRGDTEFDSGVMRMQGLHYVLTEWAFDSSVCGHWLSVENGALKRTPIDTTHLKSLPIFLDENQAFVKGLSSSLVKFLSFVVWVFAFHVPCDFD